LIDHGAHASAAGEDTLAASIDTDCKKCVQLVEKELRTKAYSKALVDLSIHSESLTESSLRSNMAPT
jgi:hypothetical protein